MGKFYEVLVGLNYRPNGSAKVAERRAEPGQAVDDLPPKSLDDLLEQEAVREITAGERSAIEECERDWRDRVAAARDAFAEENPGVEILDVTVYGDPPAFVAGDPLEDLEDDDAPRIAAPDERVA